MTDQTNSQNDDIAFIGNTLGSIFYFDPTDVRVADILSSLALLDPDEAVEDWPFSASDSPNFTQGLRDICEGLKDGIGDDLIWEYRRLFVGPATKAAPPWGSVYTDKDQVIFGASTLDLRQWMRKRGVAKSSADGDPEDHIGLMLLMMAWISQNKPYLIDEFLIDHLLPWAPHFLEILERETTHPFFKGLSNLTRASLDGIRLSRGLTVEEPRFYR